MIEILESRIAPAAVFAFTDVDGDHVTIKSSVGTNTELAAAVTLGNASAAAIGKPHQLEMLTLGAAFQGATISITATPSNDLSGGKTVVGDGFVNVGMINAPAIDLKSVTVHGDLGQIVVGDGSTKSFALGSLKVTSMGDFGLTTGANAAASRFENGVGTISIAHDVNGVLLRATATDPTHATGKIGSIFIGGNLIGGSATDTGEIAADDGIGSVKIMGNVIGGAGANSGRIASIDGGNIGSIYIGGNLEGGSAQATGAIFTIGNIASVTVKQSVIGGSAITSGGIDGGNVGAVSIGGNLLGTAFSSVTNVDHTAFIRAQGNLTSVSIGGSIQPGVETGGVLTFSGAIQSGQTLGSVKVAGSILGSADDTVIISGVGVKSPVKRDPAIGKVSIGGSATYLQIEAGYNLIGSPADGDAQMGAVAIGGDLIESDIIAGVKTAAVGDHFGSATDTAIDIPSGVTGDNIFSTIASLTVGGEIQGSATDATATFGIEAQLIGSVKTGGLALPLQKGAGNDSLFVSATDGKDVHIKELPGT